MIGDLLDFIANLRALADFIRWFAEAFGLMGALE
jgi:hypothetical protein